MKKVIAIFIALASLCPYAKSQLSIDITLYNCQTLTVTLPQQDPAQDSSIFYVVWLEKQIGAGIWKGIKQEYTRSNEIVFDNLLSGEYRVMSSRDTHEDIYLDAKSDFKKSISKYFKISDCSIEQQNSARLLNRLESFQIQLYPNPAQGVLNIQMSSEQLAKGATLELVDISGKIVFNSLINSELETFNINHLNSGAYSAIVRCDAEAVYQKVLVIQK